MNFFFDFAPVKLNLGKKNQNLHKWVAQLEGDYRTNTDHIKEACIEFYNAVVKM